MTKPILSRYLLYLLSAIILPVQILAATQDVQQKVDSAYLKKSFTGEEMVRGERLFYGLAYPPGKAVKCTECHNTIVSDTLNWNPDALVISLKYREKSAADLGKVLLSATGKKMAQVHTGFQLTPEDITLIKAYMDELVTIGLKHEKPVITNLLLFILSTIIFLFSITDLAITKKVKRKQIHYALLTVTTVYISWILVAEAIRLGRSQDYTPDQPIKFSHAIHAGQNKTDCIYCHSFAGVSKTAGIPAVNVCMNCHLLVRNGTRSGSYEIAKVINAFDKQIPIEWIKVHNLPDHVFFSHAQHTNAGGVECKDCHGATEEMHLVTQVSDLSMGWCIKCHRTRNVDFSSNGFYSEYKSLSEKMKSGIIDTVTVEMTGGIDCMKCHY